MRGKIAKLIRRKLVSELVTHLKKEFPDTDFPIKKIKTPNDLISVSNEPKKRFEIFMQYKKYYKQTKKLWKITPSDKKHTYANYLRSAN
jgi:hypothetical protein